MTFNKKSILPGMFVLMLAFSAGCLGGKGGGTTEPTPNTQPSGDTNTNAVEKTISFAVSGIPANNMVYLEEVSKNKDEITLAVKVKGGADVYGAALEITFDGSKIGYINAAEGNYLSQGFAATSFSKALEQGSTGILLIGIHRQGIITGVTGDGALCNIVFKALTEQSATAIGFNAVNNNLKSPDGTIAGTSFIGGNLSYK